MQTRSITKVRKMDAKHLKESLVQTARLKQSITVMLYVNITLYFPWFFISFLP